MKVKKKSLLESIDVLSQTKTQAEACVTLIHSVAADGGISAAQLRSLQQSYADARAMVNGGLDRLLVEIEMSGSPEGGESYEMVAARAAKQVRTFLTDSDSVIPREGVSDAGVKLGGSILSAFVDIWKTLRGEKKEKVAAFVKRVEALKWRPFEAIE